MTPESERMLGNVAHPFEIFDTVTVTGIHSLPIRHGKLRHAGAAACGRVPVLSTADSEQRPGRALLNKLFEGHVTT